jgi:hypothetical protein
MIKKRRDAMTLTDRRHDSGENVMAPILGAR